MRPYFLVIVSRKQKSLVRLGGGMFAVQVLRVKMLICVG